LPKKVASPEVEFSKFRKWYQQKKMEVGKIGLREIKSENLYDKKAMELMQGDQETGEKLRRFIENQKRDRS